MEVSLAAVLPQIFTGLVLGMIFVLLAIGLSLIFGLMTVVNFAHGALYMLGAYCTVFLLGFTRNFWVALLVAPLMVGTFGLLVERFLIRRLYGRGPDDPLLLTFGLSLVLIETAGERFVRVVPGGLRGSGGCARQEQAPQPRPFFAIASDQTVHPGTVLGQVPNDPSRRGGKGVSVDPGHPWRRVSGPLLAPPSRIEQHHVDGGHRRLPTCLFAQRP